MSKWFIINFLVLLYTTIKLIVHPIPLTFKIPMIMGFLGLLFFLFNWTRHAVFSTIRETQERETKIKLAQMSKKVLPYHRWTGSAALLFILIHAAYVAEKYGGFSIFHIKMATGLAAGLCLFLMVVSGWVRLFHPTVRMRKIHLYLGMTLFFTIVLHLLSS